MKPLRLATPANDDADAPQRDFATAPEARAPVGAAPSVDSSIDAWLAVFVRLLRLSEATKNAIHDELREHLIERVRDLELAGRSEPDAIGTALAELGETAGLAQRFTAANGSHRRRFLMNVSLIGAGAGALALAVMAWSPRTAPEIDHGSAFLAQAPDASPPESFAKAHVDGFDGALGELVTVLGRASDKPIHVRWTELGEMGIDESSEISLTAGGGKLSLAKAFEITARELTQAAAGNRVAWRFGDELIELGPQHSFDRESAQLVNYDISSIIYSMHQTYDRPYENAVADITGLLTSMVSPSDWRENGGDIAHQTVVGGRLFVEAPPRVHEKIEWILSQLRAEVEEANAAALPAMPTTEELSAAHPPLKDAAERYANAQAQVKQAASRTGLDPGELETYESALAEARRDFEAARASAIALWQGAGQTPIMPGDLITISVYELYQQRTWATSTRTVDDEGRLRLPEIGDVPAAGLTLRELKARVAERYSKSGMSQPRVSVTLDSFRRVPLLQQRPPHRG